MFYKAVLVALVAVYGQSSFMKYLENPFRSLKQGITPTIPKEEMETIRVRAMKRGAGGGMEEKSHPLPKDQ